MLTSLVLLDFTSSIVLMYWEMLLPSPVQKQSKIMPSFGFYLSSKRNGITHGSASHQKTLRISTKARFNRLRHPKIQPKIPAPGLGFWGSGFRVGGVGFRVRGFGVLGFGVQGLGFRFWGSQGPPRPRIISLNLGLQAHDGHRRSFP